MYEGKGSPPRDPCVEGLFYPAERHPVQDLIDRWWERQAKQERAVAVLVPHGAWTSCGEVAGAVFSRLQWPKAAVVLGPDHSGSESSCSLAAEELETARHVGKGLAAAMVAASKALGASGGHLVKYEARASPAGYTQIVSGYAGMIFS